jgi:hypothetical protein
MTECVETAIDQSPIGAQRLRIQRGNNAPLTIAEFPILGAPSPFGLCALFGEDRFGPEIVVAGVFQRLAVSQDGSFVLFEVTDDLAVCTPDVCLRPPTLPAESKGLFYVNADGTGLRRLAPPSLEPVYFIGSDTFLILPSLAINGAGTAATLTDIGPDPSGTDMTQIFALEIGDGARRQLTQLTPAPPPDPNFPATCCPSFVDDRTVSFASTADPDGTNPDNELAFFTVHSDGGGLTKLPTFGGLPDAEIVPIFAIRPDRPSATLVRFEREATQGPPGAVQEILLVEGTNLLQLTNFGRSDTTNPAVSMDEHTVFFVASADPLGTNPSHNCQVFAIDTLGSNLRQLTQFGEVPEATSGCLFGPRGGGCAVFLEAQDQRSGTLVLYSACDPLGTNANGSQIFTMLPDGTGLQQITDAAGLVIEPPFVGTVLPGPFAYGNPE